MKKRKKFLDYVLQAMLVIGEGPILIGFFRPFNSFATREVKDESAN